jgi:hypothetical protein
MATPIRTADDLFGDKHNGKHRARCAIVLI